MEKNVSANEECDKLHLPDAVACCKLLSEPRIAGMNSRMSGCMMFFHFSTRDWFLALGTQGDVPGAVEGMHPVVGGRDVPPTEKENISFLIFNTL